MASYTRRTVVALPARNLQAITTRYCSRGSLFFLFLAFTLAGCTNYPPPPSRADATHYWPSGSTPYSPLPTPTPSPTYVSDAPQNLLLRYIKLRKISASFPTVLRDKTLLTELLNLYDPKSWNDTLRNEISRPMALQTLKLRLDGEEPKRRLSLGMYVQLMDYDVATQSFNIYYPLRFDNDEPRYDHQYHNYITFSEDPIPEAYYTNLGTPCVTSRRPANLRPDTGSGYFVVKLECYQHSSQSLSGFLRQKESTEIPATAALRFPMSDLWKRLPVPIDRAKSFIDARRNSYQRMAWAELVFDVVQMRVRSFGPFVYNSRPSNIYHDPVVVTIKPQALFVWEDFITFATTRGPLIAAVGNVPPSLPTNFIRITANMITSSIAPHRADTYHSSGPPADRIPEDSSSYTRNPAPRHPAPDIPVPSPATKPAIRQPLRPAPLSPIPTGQ